MTSQPTPPPGHPATLADTLTQLTRTLHTLADHPEHTTHLTDSQLTTLLQATDALTAAATGTRVLLAAHALARGLPGAHRPHPGSPTPPPPCATAP